MATTLKITKEGDTYTVDNPAAPGSALVGRGETLFEAIGCWFVRHQEQLGYRFDVDDVWQAELARRESELAKR